MAPTYSRLGAADVRHLDLNAIVKGRATWVTIVCTYLLELRYDHVGVAVEGAIRRVVRKWRRILVIEGATRIRPGKRRCEGIING